eukprot:7964388-Pyramimonas_sp.AAC.1
MRRRRGARRARRRRTRRSPPVTHSSLHADPRPGTPAVIFQSRPTSSRIMAAAAFDETPWDTMRCS